MKNIRYILILVLTLTFINSCTEDYTEVKDLKAGYNLAGFEATNTSIAGISDGTEYTFMMKVKVTGPTVPELDGDVTVTVAADESSTAIAGIHYVMENPTVVLSKSNNYLGLIKVVMTTEGIETPLPENPELVLKIVSATGNPNVIANGKPLTINMNFACFTEFQGTYTVHTESSSGGVRDWTEDIIKVDTETYRTQRVGTWNPPLNPDYGFVFTNSCNVLDVPLSLNPDLADTYSNDVWSHKPGFADPVTGVLTIYYTIWFEAGNVTYTAVYTPVK